jgi:tetratricopeptide (TPR) repeat protein
LEKAESEGLKNLLRLARDLATRPGVHGADKAAEILLQAIKEGNEEPELLVDAAAYLLQSTGGHKYAIRKQAIELVDRAVAQAPEDLGILESAIHCYELTLHDFPEKFNEIIRLNLKVLDIDPENIDAMVTLASHREHPGVALSLEDAIRMLEWAQDIDSDNNIVAFALSRLYMEAGQYEEGKKLYERVLQNSEPRKASPGALPVKPLRAKTKLKRYRKYGRN